MPRELKILKSLEMGASKERELNAKSFERMKGNEVFFGQQVQLLHRKSGKYLTVNPTSVAESERENLRVFLADGGNDVSLN